jgi:F-type H+/Na+-transporting ATPase subunit beta
MAERGQSERRVGAIRSAVVDLVFEDGAAPVGDAVEIADAEGRIVVAEIQAQLDARLARAIALEPIHGWRRGDRGRRTHAPVTIQVGPAIPGRVVDILGRIGDRGPPLPTDAPRWPIHRIRGAKPARLASAIGGQIRGTMQRDPCRFGRSSAQSFCSC